MATAVSLLAGVVFGLALAAPPGPMNAVIAEESVVRGWGAGFRAGLGAATADFVFFVLAALGVVTFVEQFPTVRGAMVGVGGVLMLYFAYGAATEVRGSFDPAGDPPAAAEGDGGGDEGAVGGDVDSEGAPGRDGTVATDGGTTGFRKAFVLALTNPYQVLFWLTIGVGLLDPGRLDVLAHTPYVGDALAGTLVVRTGSAALVVGFFGGIGVWITGFPAALVSARRRVDSFAPVVAGLSAVVLGGFGVLFIVDAVRTLF